MYSDVKSDSGSSGDVFRAIGGQEDPKKGNSLEDLKKSWKIYNYPKVGGWEGA